MSAASIVIAQPCNWCTRQLPPHRVHTLASGQNICDRCLEWHLKALDFLGGGPIPGCQVCEATWEILRDRTPGVEVRLYVVPCDGINAVMCRPCMLSFVAKKPHLYEKTRFGRNVLALK